jgi:hypothetical protein
MLREHGPFSFLRHMLQSKPRRYHTRKGITPATVLQSHITKTRVSAYEPSIIAPRRLWDLNQLNFLNRGSGDWTCLPLFSQVGLLQNVKIQDAESGVLTGMPVVWTCH